MQKAMPAGRQGSALIPILLICALIALGGFYFYFPKSSPQTPISPAAKKEQLKIYTSDKLGFKFEYPNENSIKEDSEELFNKRGNGDFRKNFKGYVGYQPGEFAGAVVVLDKTGSYDQNPFTVWVFNNNVNLTIEQWYKEYWYYPFVWGDFTQKGKVELAPKEIATISGQIGKSGIIDYQPGKPKFVYVSANGKMYLFRIIGDGEKILSTFKILE